MTLFFLKALSFVLGHLPAWFGRAVGRLLGSLARRVLKRHWSTALENLELALGKTLTAEERERIAQRVFANLGMMFFEFMKMPWLKRPGI